MGVQGEASGFDRGVFVWKVRMPMFVPSDVIDLSWSDRIGAKLGEDDEGGISAAIRAANTDLPSDQAALSGMIARAQHALGNTRASEVDGYARLILGDVSGARAALSRAEAVKPEYDWERELQGRCQLIIGLLDAKESEAGVSQLQRWRDETAAALGLQS